jgi:hypothetical protein
MKKFLFQTSWVFLAVFNSIAQANTISLTYGSKYDEQTEAALFYADQWGLRLTAQNAGLIAAGYFDDGFDPVLAAQNISLDGISPILAAFNVMDFKSSIEANASGGYILVEKDVQEEGIGKTPYILLLAGVETYNFAHQSSGIGLFTDTSFSSIPAGSDLPLTLYYLDALSYDTVLLGTTHLTNDPSAGIVYIAHSLGVPPLALATSTQLSDTWWSSEWFGLFATHANSNWIFHQTYGWVFPNSTHPTGLWFYEPTQYGWLFMNSETSPNLWSETLQKWLYPNTDSTTLSFWIWNSQSEVWELP